MGPVKRLTVRSRETLLVFVLVVSICWGHIVLTYPPARKYALDFLDNVGTKEPCGMPKGLSSSTVLPAGTTFNVSWHAAYTHRGGVYVELRNSNETVIRRYPETGWALEQDVSVLTYTVQLPGVECTNCSIRLVRQAAGWGQNHLFWSCADVNIVTSGMTNQGKCSSHGTHNGSHCVCDRTYDGDHCQFKNECVDDSDCSNHGQCVDTGGTRYPKLQCYCTAGWFGRRCEKESSVKTMTSIDLNHYKHRIFSPKFELYHRIVEKTEELEVILKVKTVTWVALGWRSPDAKGSCRNFPVLSANKEGVLSGRNQTADEISGQAVNTKDQSTNHAPVVETTQAVLNSTTSTNQVEPCDGQCNSTTGCFYDVSWKYMAANKSLVFTITAELKDLNYFGLGFSSDNSMSGTDMAVGWIKSNGTIYLSDRFASGQTQPVVDSINDLTLISGENTAGVTKITFSRLLYPGDRTDYALNTSNCVYFLTAIGAKVDDTNSIRYHGGNKSISQKFCYDKCSDAFQKTPGESGQMSDGGQKTGGIGDISINSTSVLNSHNSTNQDEPCDGQCNSTTGCLYDVSWKYLAANKSLVFTITAELKDVNYFGLGFSSDNSMPGTDIAVGWIKSNGTIYLSDRYASNRTQPVVDSINDLTLISGENTAGVSKIKFSRLLYPDDPSDYALNTSNCVYFLTAIGAKVDDTNSIRYHGGNKSISEKFCFDKCSVETAQGDTTIGETPDNSSSLHPMDCIDVIVGSAKGELSRIGDYYTRDRSTPLMDEEYGGVDSLTAALGHEEAGETILLFRRKLNTSDVTDWTIDNRIMDVVWARGQHKNDTSHRPSSAYEENELTDKDYYRTDELKYHGYDDHRGQARFNFYEKAPVLSNCSNGGCTDINLCPYIFKWTYEPTNDSVTFEITATVGDNEWVAVGFSMDTEMPNTDIIAAYFLTDERGEFSKPVISDRYADGRSEPKPDDVNNVQLISGKRENGVSAFVFSRPAKTGDPRDLDLYSINTSSCPYVFYAKGGTVDSRETMKFHPTIPVVAGRVCFGICDNTSQTTATTTRRPQSSTVSVPTNTAIAPVPTSTATVSVPTSTVIVSVPTSTVIVSVPTSTATVSVPTNTATVPVPTSTVIVSVPTSTVIVSVPCSIKFPGLTYTSTNYGQLTTSAAKELKLTVENELNFILKDRVSKYEKSVVTRFREGSIIADFIVQVLAGEGETTVVKKDVTQQLQLIVSTGNLAGLKLDTTYLEVREPTTVPLDAKETDKNSRTLGEAEIIIIVVAVTLCATAISVVFYKIWDIRKSKPTGKRQFFNRKSPSANTEISSTEFNQPNKNNKHKNSKHSEPYHQQAFDNPGYAEPTTACNIYVA